MNSIFKELLESGRIDKEPVFTFTSDGKEYKGYTFSSDGWKMNESRFEEYNEVMKAYEVFKVDREDYEITSNIVKENIKRTIMSYASDAQSGFTLLNQALRQIDELEQRMEFSIPLQKSYDAMSFTVLEEDENPLVYDFQYNKEKVKRWMKDLPVEKKRPYLQSMLQVLPEVSMLLQSDSLNYIHNQVLLNASTLQILLHSKESSGLSNETKQSIKSRVETLQQNSNYLTELSRSIIST